MKKLITLFLLSAPLFAVDAPKGQPFVFAASQPACTLDGGKLILSKAWPFGSWEECAYSILNIALQLDQKINQMNKPTAATQPAK